MGVATERTKRSKDKGSKLRLLGKLRWWRSDSSQDLRRCAAARKATSPSPSHGGAAALSAAAVAAAAVGSRGGRPLRYGAIHG